MKHRNPTETDASLRLPRLQRPIQGDRANDWDDVTPAATDCRLAAPIQSGPASHTRRVTFPHGSRLVVLSQEQAEAIELLADSALRSVRSPVLHSALGEVRKGYRD